MTNLEAASPLNIAFSNSFSKGIDRSLTAEEITYHDGLTPASLADLVKGEAGAPTVELEDADESQDVREWFGLVGRDYGTAYLFDLGDGASLVVWRGEGDWTADVFRGDMDLWMAERYEGPAKEAAQAESDEDEE